MMNTLRTADSTIERREEPRIEIDIGLFCWGVETQEGGRFLQEVRARDISLSGALLSGFQSNLKSGDVIGILYLGHEARFRVVWVRYCGDDQKMHAAVRRMQPDPCPWEQLLASPEMARSAGAN
jgi:hypothetical protein